MAEAGAQREQLVAEYTLVSQLAEEMRKRIELLNASINEVAAARRALEETQNLNEGDELLVPLGAGVFVRVKLANKSSVVVTIGANIMIEKNVDEALKIVGSREQQIRDALQRSMAEYQALLNRLQELEQQIRSMSR
ncbi:MAG: prefoldin subunit alpha [Thermofilaceae archaeon]